MPKLPLHLIKFWYPEAVEVFLRSWKNTILFLEEDLAVGLMWQLLFAPLFHDATVVGRILSFIFRIIRIVMGLFAFALATVIILILSLYWFTLPVLVVLNKPPFIHAGLFFAGVGLFLIHTFTHPHKKVWQIKEGEDFWAAAKVKKTQLTFNKLVSLFEVSYLLDLLELKKDDLPQADFNNWQEVSKQAFDLAKKSGSDYIKASHLFVAAVLNIPQIDNLLLKFELTPSDFKDCLNYLELKSRFWRRVWLWDEDFSIRHLKGVNRGWLGAPTPLLDLVSEDLTKVAARVGFPELISKKEVV